MTEGQETGGRILDMVRQSDFFFQKTKNTEPTFKCDVQNSAIFERQHKLSRPIEMTYRGERALAHFITTKMQN